MQQEKEEKPEDPARLRALRSLLLERYEAVVQFGDDTAARRAADARREAEAAVRFKAARDQLARLQADYDNFRRRSDQERQQATAQAKASFLKPLLAVDDNFARAAQAIKPATEGEAAVHAAYQELRGQVQEVMRQQGLEAVGAEGDVFDPLLHEAVMRDEGRDDVPDGTVTAVFQKGYRLGDVLVRPALVRVAFS